jgi:hypothetical protein
MPTCVLLSPLTCVFWADACGCCNALPQTVLAMAVHLKDAALANTLATGLVNTVLPAQIADNGNLTYEVVYVVLPRPADPEMQVPHSPRISLCRRRPNARGYVSYALVAVCRTAQLAAFTNASVWGQARVRASVNMFAPYTANSLPWPYPDTAFNGTTYPWPQWAGMPLMNTALGH